MTWWKKDDSVGIEGGDLGSQVVSLQEYRHRHLTTYFELTLFTSVNWDRKDEWCRYFGHTLVIDNFEKYEALSGSRISNLVVIDSNLSWENPAKVLQNLSGFHQCSAIQILPNLSKKRLSGLVKEAYGLGACDVFNHDFSMLEMERALSVLSGFKMMSM